MSFRLPPHALPPQEIDGWFRSDNINNKERATDQFPPFFLAAAGLQQTRDRRFCHKKFAHRMYVCMYVSSPAPTTHPAVATRRINAIISRSISAFIISCFWLGVYCEWRHYLPREILRTHPCSYVFRQKKTVPRMFRYWWCWEPHYLYVHRLFWWATLVTCMCPRQTGIVFVG